MKSYTFLFILLVCIFTSANLSGQYSLYGNLPEVNGRSEYFRDSRPWTRWWWFASEIDMLSVQDNLVWLKNNGFGGVEIAWVYPLNRMQKDTVNYTPRQEWLSPEWTEIVTYAKKCSDSLGLGCDFTFGTLWPFGDSKVLFEEATMNLIDKNWRQEITASWEYPKKGYVIDHLSRRVLFKYGERIGDALKPALSISKTGLFCDSWEVESRYLGTRNFEIGFFNRYRYDIRPYLDSLYSDSEPYRRVRYDYMKLISEMVIEEFYKPYTEMCNKLGGYSRVQCSGAPCDIISAYASVDVPESEALLFEPAYSNIVSSAASLSGKKIVSSETFTCLYGWPRIRLGEEQTADLKLLADALFANGVNQIIWHGKPYNTAGTDTVKFYASVHVGQSGSLAPEIPAFNKYMEKVSSLMRKGVSYSDVAVYLPTEDGWVAGDMPKEKQFIWAWGEYEHRYTYFPEELKGYCPAWINGEFLEKAKFENGYLQVGDCAFKALYVDVKWMDIRNLEIIVRLAKSGLPVCMKNIPEEPSFEKNEQGYKDLVSELIKCANVKKSWQQFKSIVPLISGKNLPDFKCRKTEEGLIIFFANPKSQGLKFPLEYGQSYCAESEKREIEISVGGKKIPYTLEFKPYQSLIIKAGNSGKISAEDITFTPKTPLVITREKPDKEKWEVK